MYYLLTKAAADVIKFTVDVDKVKQASIAARESKPEQQAIEQLKAGEPKYTCVGCSA